mmetsp:Transcript_26267/g.77670  ORF Transcript_26267/g.77670 Transcript_26267/m.77670 type:complete len:145 (-) Transcript_26267:133-567(-)
MSYYDDEADMGRDEEEQEQDGQELPQTVADLANSSAPSALRGIRACKRCGILKTLEQFVNDGCENCPFLEMVDNPEKCNLCTTAFFEGQSAVMDPRQSWVAKWLRVDNYLPGVYAISVTGQFEKDIEEELESRGCRWRCRPAQS